MVADDFQRRFQAGCSLFRASRISKFRRSHINLLHSKLLELAAKKFGIGIKRSSTLFWGETMAVVYPDPTSLSISRYGFYEEGLTAMVLAYLKPGMTFLDVGAHVGYFTLLAAWLVGDTGRVHSFEPTPSTFDVLSLNTRSKANVFLNGEAVASKSGVVDLNDYGPAFSGYNSMYHARMPEATAVRVKSTRFQALAISIDEYVSRED